MATSSSAFDDEFPMEEGMPELLDDEDVPSTLPSLVEQNVDTAPKGADEFKLVKRKRKAGNAVDVVMEDVSQPDDSSTPAETTEGEPKSAKRSKGAKGEFRVVAVPKHRYTPLKDNWVNIFTPIVKNLGLQIRFNLKKRQVELRNPADREETTDLQKATDFVRAFILGFEVNDAIALIRLDHLFLETFEIADVKHSLKGDHVSRAIGRIAGKDGRTKLVIENTTKTRIVVANTKIHILGAYQNLKLARNAVCSLILGKLDYKDLVA
ncbi:hypothetical protein GCK72_003638 [Caenorhabditis remanei]|uniref:K Homology domain-containing protein n=1 Tax=Caenorhabditis remanei TaxID=31234 RepID=A0A6A5HB80_CAERE|nr:hypothetical protein GCK72_003638 [Caenorhabditis remanei]KAF1763693.1 hypothetical protein GCK72_003638 [Caenorhabditis remanei]